MHTCDNTHTHTRTHRLYVQSDYIKANSNQLSFKINQLKLSFGVFGRLSVALFIAAAVACYLAPVDVVGAYVTAVVGGTAFGIVYYLWHK